MVAKLLSNGVGQGSVESVGNLVQNNAPSDTGAAMDQKQAAALAEIDDLAPLPKTGDVAASISASAIFSQIYAADDCGSLKSAIVSFQKWRGSSEYNLSQFPDQIQNSDKAIMDSLADKLKDILDKASEECKKSDGKGAVATAQAGCLESILDHIANPPHTGSGVWNDLQTKMLDKFGNRVVADADNNLAKCLPSYTASGGSGYNFSGKICSLKNPFKLKADGMEHFTVDFTPSSVLSGSMNAVGTGSADGMTCSDGGSGTYIVNLNSNGAGNIIVTIPPSTLNCPGSSRSNTVVQVFNITPLADNPGDCSQP